MANSTAAGLRHLYEYASHHNVFSLDLLLRAADEMDRMQEQLNDLREYYRENERALYEQYRNRGNDNTPNTNDQAPVADDRTDDADGM